MATARKSITEDNSLLSTNQVCALLGLSRGTVTNLQDRGELAFVRIGKLRRTPRRALQEFIDRRAVRR
jgi:excisionase family DNA binding protein